MGQATLKDAMRILGQQRRKLGLAEDSPAPKVGGCVQDGQWSGFQQRTGTIWLILPYPPTANRYWRHCVQHGRLSTYVSEEARRFKELVAGVCACHRIRPIASDVDLTIWAYRPQKSGDTDNRIKVVQDALQGWAYEDDELVSDIEAHRLEATTRPHIEVRIRPIQQLGTLGKDDHGDCYRTTQTQTAKQSPAEREG